MNIRKFEDKDAIFCFKIRSNSYAQKFKHELTTKEISACINTFTPEDFINMSKKVKFFIIENRNNSIGFFTIKRINEITAEIPLIYIDLEQIGKNFGKNSIEYIENWIISNWEEVKTLIVDTIIPGYNGGFYKKMGFAPSEESYYNIAGLNIKGLRFYKNLNMN